MFKFVKAILDKSKEQNVDLSVAEIMVMRDFPDNIDEISNAHKLIARYYYQITAFRRDGSEKDIEELVELVMSENKELLEQYLEEREEFFEESYKKAAANN